MDRGAWQAYNSQGCTESDMTEHLHSLTQRDGVGGRLVREEIYVCMCLIHFSVR